MTIVSEMFPLFGCVGLADKFRAVKTPRDLASVQLLMVIVIITILAAMLPPESSAAKRKAKIVYGNYNLRQIGCDMKICADGNHNFCSESNHEK